MPRRLAEVIATDRKKVSLKSRDLEILKILSFNSRTTLSQIADYLKTSDEVVLYHYKKLKKDGILLDDFTAIDPKILGVNRYTLYLQFKTISREKMSHLVKDFLDNKFINWVIETGGKWEVILMFETLHEEKYDSILESILSPIKDFINDYTIAQVTNFVHTTPKYFQGPDSKELKHRINFPYDKEFLGKKIAYSPDDKDIMILKLLLSDSRIGLTDLGKKVGLSKDAVNYRIKKLISYGIIKSFLIRLNYHLLNYQYNSIMIKFRGISEKRKKEFFSYLYSDNRFWALMEQIGPWDVSLMMFFENPKSLRDFMIDLKEHFSDVIHSYESVLHFDQYFYTYLCDGVYEELLEKYKSK
jgi:DNA-binding Lrp family transcriptional regulator